MTLSATLTRVRLRHLRKTTSRCLDIPPPGPRRASLLCKNALEQQSSMASNSLYYGDNLDILRRYIRDESVDLVYLDPPFKSNQTYNVLFQEKDGSQSASQIKAFVDTWQWDEAAARSYEETVEAGGQVAQALIAFRQILGTNDMLAYLSMMAPRLVELWEGSEADRQPLPALRSDGKPLSEAPAGFDFRPHPFQDRDYLETHQRPQRH